MASDQSGKPGSSSFAVLNDRNGNEHSFPGSPATTSLPVPGSSPFRPHSLASSYQRASFASSARGTVILRGVHDEISEWERKRAIDDERALLEDNNLIAKSPKPWVSSRRSSSLISRGLNRERSEDREEASAKPEEAPTETTSLLTNNRKPVAQDLSDDIDQTWQQAILDGKIHTTWQREAKVIWEYTVPLILTFLLENSLTVASIFAVGRIGQIELGAVSLASMTANITGFAVYQGLSTSLDTLCAQAYGSGKKHLVGLQMQRMTIFLWLMSVPIGLIWWYSDKILMLIVPEKEVALLAGQYLRIVLSATPGFAAFESGKRFVQAQGLFSAGLYVLLICAPLNGLLNYLFVWKLDLGFIGAPMAVTITSNLMPLLLFLYVYFIAGRECWNGFTMRAFENWGPMIKLALPGFLMLESEVMAFEILTLSASYLGTTALAAQSVLGTISSLAFQIPFPLSIAGSTRVANLIGATLTDSARTTARVTLSFAFVIGCFNLIVLSLLRNQIPYLFTSDREVATMVAQVVPVCASFQVVDSIAANCNGILRGLGRQDFGGYIQLLSYYVIGLPVSFVTTFVFGFGLRGTWSGIAIGLAVVAFLEAIYLVRCDWERSVNEAKSRNMTA